MTKYRDLSRSATILLRDYEQQIEYLRTSQSEISIKIMFYEEQLEKINTFLGLVKKQAETSPVADPSDNELTVGDVPFDPSGLTTLACLNCGSRFEMGMNKKFCSASCRIEYKRKRKLLFDRLWMKHKRDFAFPFMQNSCARMARPVQKKKPGSSSPKVSRQPAVTVIQPIVKESLPVLVTEKQPVAIKAAPPAHDDFHMKLQQLRAESRSNPMVGIRRPEISRW